MRYFVMLSIIAGVALALAGPVALTAVEQRVPNGQLLTSRFYTFDVNTDIEATRELAETLDAMHAEYRRRFGRAVSIDGLLTVRFLANRQQFEAYGRQHCRNFNTAWNAYYLYGGTPERCEMVLFYQADGSHLATALHEGFHQFIHAGIPNIGRLPQWFNEGMAEYFEIATISERGRMTMGEELSSDWEDELRRFIANDELVPLEALFHIGLDDWSNEHLERHYASAYALIHYMAEENPRATRALIALMDALARGADYDEALAVTMGRLDLEALEAEWHAWVRDRLAESAAD